jgi:hypothetical protein
MVPAGVDYHRIPLVPARHKLPAVPHVLDPVYLYPGMYYLITGLPLCIALHIYFISSKKLTARQLAARLIVFIAGLLTAFLMLYYKPGHWVSSYFE